MLGLVLTMDFTPRTKKRPASPQNNGRTQSQFDPTLHGHVHSTQTMAQHGQYKNNGSQRQRPPKSALKIPQFGVVVVQLRQNRLKCHPALRATARMVLTHLRVHGAGVHLAGRSTVNRRRIHILTPVTPVQRRHAAGARGPPAQLLTPPGCRSSAAWQSGR